MAGLLPVNKKKGIHVAELTTGQNAPDFELPRDEGGTRSLADLRGKIVVLYFYPKDDTSGCTVEACEFRDRWPDVVRRDVRVFGISPDDAASHQRFREKFSLPFPLLVDEGHRMAERYGVWGEKQLYGRRYMGVHRTTFVLDGEGRIRRIFEKVKPEGHAAEVLAAVDELQAP